MLISNLKLAKPGRALGIRTCAEGRLERAGVIAALGARDEDANIGFHRQRLWARPKRDFTTMWKIFAESVLVFCH
jgi:hypothetical protein